MSTTFKVLTRQPFSQYPFRTFMEYATMAAAMEAAVRLEKNTELEVLIELPNNEVQKVPLHLLDLKA